MVYASSGVGEISGQCAIARATGRTAGGAMVLAMVVA